MAAWRSGAAWHLVSGSIGVSASSITSKIGIAWRKEQRGALGGGIIEENINGAAKASAAAAMHHDNASAAIAAWHQHGGVA